MYAKEIYQVAKNGGVTPEGNPSLKRLIEKAKKDKEDYIKEIKSILEKFEVYTLIL